MTIRIMIQDVPEGEAVQEERGQEEAADRLGVVLIPMEHLPEAPQEEVHPEALHPEALHPEVLLQGEVPEEGEAREGPEVVDITAATTVRIMEEGTESPGMITGSLHWEGFF